MPEWRIAADNVPPIITVEAWRDEFVEDIGHRPGSPYVEYVYLGRLGPSALLCWQRLARVAGRGVATDVDTVDLAQSLGLGTGLGRNSPLGRTLGRLIGFEAMYWGWSNAVGVRLALPMLSDEQVRRLSPSARAAHRHLAG